MQDVIAGFRLSPQQQRLWLWQQESVVFQARCMFEIEGPLDLNIFREGLRMVIERHEILHTFFHYQTDLNLPLQIIGAPSAPEWQVEDLSERSSTEQQQRIEEVFMAQDAPLFDLEKGPLVRLEILRLAARRHVMLLTLPSLCADNRTIKNMVHELGLCYDACVRSVNDLPQPTQYVQFSEWQNELLEDGDESGREYWRRQCRSSSPVLTLPFERRIPTQTEFKAGCFPLVFARDVVETLLTMAETDGSRLRDFLLAGWHTLLWRLTGQSSATVGVEVDGRKFEELYDAFGLFAKYLPLPHEFERDAPFSEVVRVVSEALRDGLAWQEYFAWEDCYADAGDNAGLPSFAVQFSFEEWPAERKVGDLQLRFLRSGSCVEEYKLKLRCLHTDNGIVAEFHFDLRVLAPEQVQLIARCFETLVRAAIADPEQAVGALEIVSEDEYRHLSAGSRPRRDDWLPQATIQRLFEEQAGRIPEALAAWHREDSLNYAELNARANRLAHFLRRRGVGPNVLVALCVTRSLEMLVGLLGVLKAGGAYLPLDPDHPPTRLAYQIAEGRCPILLTEEKLLSRVPDFTSEAFCFDRDRQRLDAESSENPDPVNSPSDLAYVIFTSGSTGVPKGVEITHQNLANYASFICEMLRRNQTSNRDGFHFATVSTLSADLGNTCIFPSLISGGCLHILDYEVVTDGQKFAEYLIEHPIDVLKIVPSHLNALLPSLKRSNVFPRSYLIVGGETFSFDFLKRIAELSGQCQVFNHYGPTETTVGSLVHPVNQHQESYEWARTVPIGRPIANTEIFILDDRRKLVPPGVVGELYVGGAGLARGYLNRPQETDACFIKDPFSSNARARLYRTGDLARYLPDGNVEFCGRADQQVKVNGFRIELGEIENVLRQHPDLREAVVDVCEDELAHKHLVAYCVPQGESAPSPSELRSALTERLPSYMIPQRFMMLKALPLTPNGKLDRRALPDQPVIQSGALREIVPPRTPAEKELTQIWKDVLGVGNVGVHDNFFELGGDSVLTIQIIARARQAGLAISPKQVFDYPTIAALAEFAATNVSVSVDQGPVSGPLPLLPIQQWFFERNLPEPQHYNQAILLEVKKPALDASAIEKTVRHLLLHHDALRLRFKLDASGWRQFNASPEEVGELPFVAVDLSRTPPAAQPAAIEREVARLQTGLDLSDGPLVRAAYFDLGTNRPGRLLLVYHHLVMDGVSWRIVLEDLHRASEQANQGEPISLPAKTTSFKAWAERLVSYAQSTELRREASYWLARERASVEPLPVDSAHGQNTLASAHTIELKLNAEETRALLSEIPAAYHTQINDVLLTALVEAFARWCGHRSLLVDLEGHGREPLFDDVDLTRTIGWFTTHFPVLLVLGSKLGPAEALKSIKEQLRQIPNRGIGYGVLRYLSRDATLVEGLRELPQSQVSFNYLGQLDRVLTESSLFSLAPETVSETQSLRGNLSHLLRFTASVTGGQLRVLWTYSQDCYRQETIEKLSCGFQEALQALISDCRSSKGVSYSPSDFPDAELSQKELDLICVRLNETGADPNDLEDIYLLSPMQQGMLFQSLYNPEGDAYFRQLSFALHGELDVQAFQQAWQRVIERHPVLRTSFFWEGTDKPVQMVRRDVTLPLVVHDWRELAADTKEERLKTYLREEQGRALQLTKAPLMRLTLIRLADDVHQFVWSYHHLLIDGWSRALIYKEVLALYEAFHEARDADLEPRRPYRDYIRWLRTQDLAKAEAFWRDRLKGFATPTPLGTPRVASSSGAGDFTEVQKLQLPAELSDTLQATARQRRLTGSTLVQGAWALMLANLSGQSEVVFGTVVSGRSIDLPGSESMIGPFLNTLPMRVQISPKEPVWLWLTKIQQQQLELREFEYSPLEVQRWSEVSRNQPLFESAVNYANYYVDAALRRKNQSIEVRNPNFVERMHNAVVLEAEPGPPLTLSLLYDNRRFNIETIVAMLAELESTLIKLTTDTDRLLEELFADQEPAGTLFHPRSDSRDPDDAKSQYVF